MNRSQARRGLAIYGAVVLVCSALCEGAMIRAGKPIGEQVLFIFLLMWTPSFAALVARLVLREGIRDVSFRVGGMPGVRMAMYAWLLPVAVGLVAYGTAWSFGLETYAQPASLAPPTSSRAAQLAFTISLFMNLTLGTVLSALTAAGEEFGWRGYMLTRLLDAGVPRPVLVSGLLWGVWHLPLIVAGIYAAGPYPALSAGLFMFSVTAAGYIAAKVRLVSGSVWPAVLFHASWNAVIQGTFDVFTVGGDASRGTTLWTGEAGILTVVVLVATAFAFTWRPWPVRRHPKEPEPLAHLRAGTA